MAQKADLLATVSNGPTVHLDRQTGAQAHGKHLIQTTAILKSLVAIIGLSMTGCGILNPCKKATVKYRVVDKIECYVFAGFGTPPECLTLESNLPTSAKPTSSVPVWLRTVYAGDLDVPIPGRTVRLDLVDAFGRPARGPTITPSEVTTLDDGFAPYTIILNLNDTPGVFRIKLTYPDKATYATGYSPPIISLSDASSNWCAVASEK